MLPVNTTIGVESAAALDTAMSLGLGFPKHIGGPLKYADQLGIGKVVELSDGYSSLGPLYVASPKLRSMAAAKSRFF